MLPIRKLKPYQLVWLEEGIIEDRYSFIGETISFPTLVETIMVRRIPGNPLSMVEVPACKVRLVDGERQYHWIHYAEVRGKLYFPIDMLRYDSCAPANFRIEKGRYYSIKTVLSSDNEWCKAFGERLIVAKIWRTRQSPWTVGRWNSFGWSIDPMPAQPFVHR